MTSTTSSSTSQRPNVLIIIADQLTTAAVGSFGGQYGCTPNIDKLANAGTRFNCAYTHTPLCQPARAAMWTGRFPHQTGVLGNGGPNHPHVDHPIDPAMPTLGKLLTSAGYHAVHFGKTHDKGALAGFEIIDPKGSIERPAAPDYPLNHDSFGDMFTTQKSCAFLQSYGASNGAGDNSSASQTLPFLAVADLVNPHNICQWVGENKDMRNETLSPEDDARLPALPVNFRNDDFEDRPLPVRYLCCSHRRQGQSAKWSDATWRRYIDAYQYYTRMVDEQIGQILDALAKRSDADNTFVILAADHGDGLASHRIATKHTAFYDNITRVPLVVCTPKAKTASAVKTSSDSLVSLLDLLPTVCDIAGVQTPLDCAGQSLLPVVMGESTSGERKFVERDYVVCQWYTEWGQTISPGRMVRSARYKYTHYLEGDGEELFDMTTDPGETRTLHKDPAHAEALAAHRAMLKDHVQRTGDPYFSYDVFVPQSYRDHPSGYEHHPEDQVVS